MKRILYLLLALAILISSFPTIDAAAADSVTAMGTGYQDILFSNNYRGFCLDRELHGAEAGGSFTTTGAAAATSNYDGSNVSQKLKILFTQCFESIFTSNGNGSYSISNTNTVQAVVWYFTDNQYVWGEQKTLVDTVNSYSGPAIPDYGAQRTLANGDVITFSFQVIQPGSSDIQEFFAYAFTVTQNPPHEHSFGSQWESDGTRHWKECECGEKEDLANHSGGTANCINPAACEICKQTYGSTNPDNHTGKTELRGQKDATEDAPGYTGDTHCADCGKLLIPGQEIFKPHSHVFEESWRSNNTQHWRECKCGEKEGMEAHSGGTADCSSPAACDICKQSYGSTDPDNHTGKTELRGRKEATEDAPGYTGDTYCADCGKLLIPGQEIPKLHTHDFGEIWRSNGNQHWKECECGEKDTLENHGGGSANCKTAAICDLCKQAYGGTNPNHHTGKTELRDRKEATKEAPGYTGDTYCADCGKLLTYGKEIPRLSDDSGDADPSSGSANPPTDSSSASPATGDTFNVPLYVTLCSLSLLICAALLAAYKKANKTSV